MGNDVGGHPVLEISCVLTGDKYSEDDVYRLQRQVEKNITLPYRFVCVSDRLIPDVHTIFIAPNDWGVWNKMHLFNLLRETIYFDLDVKIQSNINSLVCEKLTMVHCDWKPLWVDDTQYGRFNTLKNSSIMSWKGDYSHIYRDFMKDPDYHMVKYPGTDRFLDQGYHIRTYPRGTAFSRAHGTELGVMPNDGIHFKDPTAIVCLYNGLGKEKMKEDLRINKE